MTLTVDQEIDSLDVQINSLIARKNFLINQREHSESKEWIQETGISVNDIERPMFRHIHMSQFIEYLQEKSLVNDCRKFCEWNGRIYYVPDFLSKRLSNVTPGIYSDVPL